VDQLLLFLEELEEVFIQKLLMLELILLEKLKKIYHKILQKTQLQLLIMLVIMLEILLVWELIFLDLSPNQHVLL
jgi:hypothetical protein